MPIVSDTNSINPAAWDWRSHSLGGLPLGEPAVLAFAKEFAFTPEIADRMGVRAPELKQHLAELGVYPHASVTNGAGHIWRRADLEGIAASNI